MIRPPFLIGGNEISPGSRASINLELPGLSTYTPIAMPVHVIHGRREGPKLFVCAAIHGDEINGVEIIRQLLGRPGMDRLQGTLVAVPIVNVYGFLVHSRYLPDRRDLNRSFPGTEHGSLASRIASVFAQEILDQCTHGIDLHTGGIHRFNHPHIRANLDEPATEKLARAFGTPVIINANIRDGSLRQIAAEKGIPILLYEAGEALRFDSLAIRAGVRGIRNVMREIGMIPQTKKSRSPVVPIIARSSSWVRAPSAGIFRATKQAGSQVRKGERLGLVSDPFGENESEVVAPFTGIVVGRTNLPIISEGDALFHIARFKDSAEVVGAIQVFQEEHLEGLGPGDYAPS